MVLKVPCSLQEEEVVDKACPYFLVYRALLPRHHFSTSRVGQFKLRPASVWDRGRGRAGCVCVCSELLASVWGRGP